MGIRVLVTGGAGFIGSHVTEALLDRGDEVVCVDSFDDFYDPAIKRRNIASLQSRAEFSLVEGDIRDRDLLNNLGRNYSPDGVIHLAARAGVRPSIQEPALYSEVNLMGTVNVLELARELSIRSFVFASSSSIYGERREIPFRETDPVDHPVSPYAATKKGGELLCFTYHHLHGLNVTCLRYFTVYGPRQRPEMAIHKFTRIIDDEEPVPLFGDGSSERDYTYVDDIVQGTLSALDRADGYSIYNLGNHQMIELGQLVASIAEKLNKKADIDERPTQPGDVSRTCADIELARRELDYQPGTPLEAGIDRFVDWYLSMKIGC